MPIELLIDLYRDTTLMAPWNVAQAVFSPRISHQRDDIPRRWVHLEACLKQRKRRYALARRIPITVRMMVGIPTPSPTARAMISLVESLASEEELSDEEDEEDEDDDEPPPLPVEVAEVAVLLPVATPLPPPTEVEVTKPLLPVESAAATGPTATVDVVVGASYLICPGAVLLNAGEQDRGDAAPVRAEAVVRQLEEVEQLRAAHRVLEAEDVHGAGRGTSRGSRGRTRGRW